MKVLKWADCKNDADRLRYHAHVYAWRIFRGLATPDQRTSPVDPTGQWYDPIAIRDHLEDMQAEQRNRKQAQPNASEDRLMLIAAQEERYARGLAYREGRLAEYDKTPLAERIHRERLNLLPSGRRKEFRFTDREIRTRLQWARDHGYETWNDFLDAVKAGKESVVPYVRWYNAEFAPPDTAGTFKSLGQAMGNAMREISTGKPAPRSGLASYPDEPT